MITLLLLLLLSSSDVSVRNAVVKAVVACSVVAVVSISGSSVGKVVLVSSKASVVNCVSNSVPKLSLGKQENF
jgi:hypothetical protein